jgi:hypothetical protein
MQVEQVFDIRDAEHTPGTNRYIFRYPEHWRLIQNQELSIGIRSIKLIREPLYLWWNDIKLQITDTKSLDIDDSCLLNSGQTMVELNSPEFTRVQQNVYDQWLNIHAGSGYWKNNFQIHYDMANERLIIDSNHESAYFILDPSNTNTPFPYFSKDFERLVNVRSTVLANPNADPPTEQEDGFFLAYAKMIQASVYSDHHTFNQFASQIFESDFEDELKHIEISNRDISQGVFDWRRPFS